MVGGSLDVDLRLRINLEERGRWIEKI